MKTFKKMAAQGDLMIRKIESLPVGVKPENAEKGVFVVAHSETGHNHVIEATPNVQLYTTGDPMISYLQVIEATDEAETIIKHLRSFDTHEPIKIDPGIYEIRRQREYTPEGWRRVEDQGYPACTVYLIVWSGIQEVVIMAKKGNRRRAWRDRANQKRTPVL